MSLRGSPERNLASQERNPLGVYRVWLQLPTICTCIPSLLGVPSLSPVLPLSLPQRRRIPFLLGWVAIQPYTLPGWPTTLPCQPSTIPPFSVPIQISVYLLGYLRCVSMKKISSNSSLHSLLFWQQAFALDVPHASSHLFDWKRSFSVGKMTESNFTIFAQSIYSENKTFVVCLVEDYLEDKVYGATGIAFLSVWTVTVHQNDSLPPQK